MKALTVQQPWAWAIFQHGERALLGGWEEIA